MESSGPASDLLEALATELVGSDRVRVFTRTGGSEDCASLMRRAQAHGAKAGFFLYGCNQNGHHRSDFDIQDTESLPLALAMLTGLVCRINGSCAK